MKSPCINVCRLAEDRCEGCARTREEIAKWSKMSDRERDAILDRLRLDFLRKVDEFLWTLQMTRLPEGSIHYTEAEALRDRARGLLAVEPDPEDALRDAAGERLRAMGYDLDELDQDNPYNADLGELEARTFAALEARTPGVILPGAPCPTCGSKGFDRSTLGADRCTFCDGTEGGNPPEAED